MDRTRHACRFMAPRLEIEITTIVGKRTQQSSVFAERNRAFGWYSTMSFFSLTSGVEKTRYVYILLSAKIVGIDVYMPSILLLKEDHSQPLRDVPRTHYHI